MELITDSPEQTITFGEKIGGKLQPGDIVAFYGELGSGKTTMIKGICLGLGVKEQFLVKSPSFIMINEYKGKFPIYHIDLFRVKTEEELLSIGFDDYLEGNGICLIEWAEKAERYLPRNTIKIELRYLSNYERKILISGLSFL
ncbi:MAG: tRNA (adenosine(37)-N6)-threonylcarbamoyltransferase complex ATPase subunit type 1 TsaE [candidate division WOR-3 bacterium]